MTHGSGLSPLYGLTLGLTFAAALGWPFLCVFVLAAGLWLGKQHAPSPNQEKDKSER